MVSVNLNEPRATSRTRYMSVTAGYLTTGFNIDASTYVDAVLPLMLIMNVKMLFFLKRLVT